MSDSLLKMLDEQAQRVEPLQAASAQPVSLLALLDSQALVRQESSITTLGMLDAEIARRNQPVISGNSFFERALDTIGAPQQGLFGLLTREEGESAGQAILRGMQENTRFADILSRKFGEDAYSTSTFLLGLSGDILFDPLNLVGAGLFRAAGKAVTGAGSAAKSLAVRVAPNLSRRLYETAIKPIANRFSKTALLSDVEKDFTALADLEIGKAQIASQKILLDQGRVREIAERLAKDSKLPLDDVLSEITRRVEVKISSQLAFPFAAREAVSKSLGNPQLSLDIQDSLLKDLGDAYSKVRDVSLQSRAPSLPAAVEREIAAMATTLKQQFENILVRERQFGLSTARLEDATVDYATHLLTKEARGVLPNLPNFANLGREFNPRHSFQLARVLNESHPAIREVIEAGGSADIQTLNKLWQDGKLFPQLGKQISKLFTDDPFAIAAVRLVRGEKAIADAQIIIKTVLDRRFGTPKAGAPIGWRSLNLPNDARFDRLRNLTDRIALEPRVADHLEKLVEMTLLPDGLNKFLKAYDSITNIWKGTTLAIFPAYHLRNTVGNLWNNALAGVTNPRHYADAMKLQVGRGSTFTVGGRTMAADELAKMLEDFGVTRGGFLEGEVSRKTLRALGQPLTAEDIPAIGRAVSFGLKTGTQIENNARIAHFLAKLDEGLSPLDAAMSVKRFLFDYSTGLTEFEQKVMRRIFPFYAWTRFNIPLQIQAIVENPKPLIHLSQLANTVRTKGNQDFEQRAAQFRGEDSKYVASFIKENVGIPFRIGPEGQPEYFLLSGWLPAADLEVLGRPNGFIDRFKDLLSPFLKLPTELLSNRELFTGRELEEFPGETTKFLTVEMRRKQAHILKAVRLLAEADRILKHWDRQKELSETDQSVLSTVTRFFFGLKGFEARPHLESRRIRREQRETIQHLRRAVRQDLPHASDLLRDSLIEEE